MSNKECRRDWSSGILSDRQLEVLSGYNTTVDDWSDCPLISPFIPRQVKTGGIISYGLSSYGYDVRISDEFKIISSSIYDQLKYDWLVENEAPSYKIPKPTIIDPTELDPLIFEDFKGSEIIIPPHGFVLGRTIEVVNIPRDVMVIALAKSTWARCFTGDTKVALVDGRALSFLELIDGVSKGERYWGYTIKTDGTIGVEELKNPRLISQNEELVEVTLNNEQTIRVTPDHEFMLRDGSYCQAQNLQPDTSLMPLYRYISEIQQAQLDGDVATNHTVVSVKKLDYKEAVYCLEVPNTNNFALESGVFVHNCGLVVGVTPLEPGFEGTVTIELSNTTNLPIRVKAGHGICQFLFLKGSQPCEVSYADRGGKYMGQIGVTLPRNVNDEG